MHKRQFNVKIIIVNKKSHDVRFIERIKNTDNKYLTILNRNSHIDQIIID